MTVRPQPREVKQLAVRTFLALGAAPQSLFGLKETLFVDRDRCVARSYRADALKAVWWMDEGTVHFYDADGQLLQTVNLLEELMPQAAAA